MLPGYRLVVATFLFGFVLVLAALRVATVTRMAHESPSKALWPMAAALPAPPSMPPVPAITSYQPENAPPQAAFTVPVMFNMDSVISTLAVAPAPASPARDTAPANAALAPLTILAGIALPEPKTTQGPVELAPLTVLSQMALQPVEAATPTQTPGVTDVTGSVEPLTHASSSPPGMDALNKLDEQPPVSVLVRLPRAKPPLRTVAKPQLRAKPKAASVKRPPARQALVPDPFNFGFGSFDNQKRQRSF
jgi:hypothetical protein